MLDFGPPLVVVYLLADIGSVAGGWLSSHLIHRGASANRARKSTMLIMAMFALPMAFASAAPNMWVAVLLIGIALSAHQGFSVNLYALPGDFFRAGRQRASSDWVASAARSAAGLMSSFAGNILTRLGSYQPIFVVAACAYLIALLAIHLIVPRWTPVRL